MSKPPLEKSRILIVDDHPLFREGLRQMIERNPELTVCGEAADAPEALQAIAGLKPDLVLVDISLAGASGIDLIKSIKTEYEDLPVLVVSMHDESLYAERALRAGAMGYVMKQEPGKIVKAAISKVLAGEIHLSERMSTAVLSKLMGGKSSEPVSALQTLSDRELEVFRMLGHGKGTRHIAEELNVTVPTVNSFRARIKEKLHLKSATEVMLHAIQWCREDAAK
jgi:DNA-binding NarL/FixJ family response regulator